MDSAVVEQIKKIDNYIICNEPIPCMDAVRTLTLIKDESIKRERRIIPKISNLKIEHPCYETLQFSYRLISKEIDDTFTILTDENLASVLRQYKIAHTLEQVLEKEDLIPLGVIMEMNNRTIKHIKSEARVFKKDRQRTR